jgi:transcriptional regulator with XRE-family HTH domain
MNLGLAFEIPGQYISCMGMFGSLGPTLILLRTKRGLTQSQLARKAGVGKSSLSKYEKGKEFPKLPSLEKILDALAISRTGFFNAMEVLERVAEPAASEEHRLPPFPPTGTGLIAEVADRAAVQLIGGVVHWHRQVVELMVRSDAAKAGRSA